MMVGSPMSVTHIRNKRPDLRRDCDEVSGAHMSVRSYFETNDLIYEGIATYGLLIETFS